jgi:small subunit ribosomal protein S6
MALYEHIFMSRPDVTAQQVEGLTDQYKTVVESGGGKVTKQEYWGVKSLAYRIRKNRKAHFTLLNLDAPHAAVAEMERQMRLSEDVIRFITVRVDAHEDGPSIMMQKRDERRERDERFGDRGGGYGGGRDRDRDRDRERGPRREREAPADSGAAAEA